MPVVLGSKSKRRNKRLEADEELIAKSLKRFKITAEAEAESRRQGLEDLRFSIGTGQWDESVKANREIEGKPCLTINRAPAFLRQYTGEERQHRPAMLVSPVGSGATTEEAKIHQGVLRHIEVISVADVVYDTAYDMMMRIGWCPWRIKTDYTSESSFEQEPRIEIIENPFSVYLSPVRRPDGTDPLWAHVVNDYSEDEYEAEFGNLKENGTKLTFPTQMGNAEPGWVTKDGARVAEYWWIDVESKVLCLLDDGTSKLKEDLSAEEEKQIIDRRDTVTRKVNCVIHDALRVLKRYEYLGKFIPFPEVNGVRLNVNGKIYRAGMVRDYRDAQRIYDFMVTRQVEQVDMVSKDPLWVPEGNAQWFEQYRQMNRMNYAYLPYKAYDEQGRQLPRPERAGREAPIQAMAEVIKQADYDMKSVIGVYDSTLGDKADGTQESGFAIMQRQEHTDTGMLPWHDNLNRAIHWQGLILLDLWPKLIDQPRVQRIVNPDDTTRHAVVFNSEYNQPPQPGVAPEEAQKLMDERIGLKRCYDVQSGNYDIVLSTGPMYQTARKEGFKAMTAVVMSDPQAMLPMFGDIWMKNADFPDAKLAADRFKKMLPPNLQDESADDAQSKLVQAQAQLQQLRQQHDIMVQELNRASDTIRTKRLELESKERIALVQMQHDLVMQQLKSHDEGAQSHLEEVLGAISQRLALDAQQQTIAQDAGAAPDTPELPGQVEPKVQPIAPAAPTPRPQPVGAM
jgi:hypothetical protein